MTDATPLLALEPKAALRFFHDGLQGLGFPQHKSYGELLHVAETLASFIEPPPCRAKPLVPLPSLFEFFDQFVPAPRDLALLRYACAQNLLLNGFMRGQMRRRHNVALYDEIGRKHYACAAKLTESPAHRELYAEMAEHFPLWTLACFELHRRILRREHSFRIH